MLKPYILSPLPVFHKDIGNFLVVLPVLNKSSQSVISESLGGLGRVVRVIHDEAEVSVQPATNHCNFELHQVHGEGTRFISKNILYLAQFLVERGRLDITVLATERAVHEPILIDEVTLRHLDDLDRDN